LPWRELGVEAEYRYATPALFLPREAVLSVFSVDAYHEAGGRLRYRLAEHGLRFEGHGYADVFDDGTLGLRLGTSVAWDAWGAAELVAAEPWRPRAVAPLRLRAGYQYAAEESNGYHQFRAAALYQFAWPFELGTDHYLYAYRVPIHGSSVALVSTAHASWRVDPSGRGPGGEALGPAQDWKIRVAGTLGTTPYERFEAQMQAQLVMDYRWGEP
jgi:hypothetical protein